MTRRILVLFALLIAWPTAGRAADGPIGYGESVLGYFATYGEIHRYTFTGTANDIVRIQAFSTGEKFFIANPQAALYGPNGQSWSYAEVYFGLSLPESGAYSIAVTGNIGGYRLRLDCLTCSGEVRSLAYGETVNVTSSTTIADQYTFTGDAGDLVVLMLGNLPGSVTNPCMELRSPTHVLLDSSCVSIDRRMDAELPVTGPYHVIVRQAVAFTTYRPYSLTLERIYPARNARAIAFGEVLTETLQQVAEIDSFTFAGSVGDVVSVTVRTLIFPPCVELVHSLTVRQRRCLSVENRLTVTLQGTGLFTFLVTREPITAYYSIGAYTVELTCVSGSCARTPPGVPRNLVATVGPRPLSGTGTPVTLTWLPPSTGDPPSSYVVEVGRTPGVVEATFNTNSAAATYTMNRDDGEHFIRVRARNPAGDSAPSNQVQAIVGEINAPPVSFGETRAGTFDAVGEVDWYAVDASAGAAVVIQASPQPEAPLHPCLDLLSPGKMVLATACGSPVTARLDVQLAQTGTHYLRVRDAASQVGAYTLSFEQIYPAFRARQLQYEEAVTDAFEQLGDVDLFTFDGTLGDDVVITTTATGTASPCVELFYSANVKTASCDGGMTSRLQTRLQGTGLFTVMVRERDHDASDSYSLVLQCVGGPCVPVAAGAPRQLAASVSGNSLAVTWLAPLEGDPPTSYVFEAGPAPSAVAITRETGSAATTFATSLPDGTHFIRVRARNAAGVGPPSNEVRVIAGPGGCSDAPARPLGAWASVTGQRVTLGWPASTSAQRYVIDAGSLSGASDLVVFDTGNALNQLVVAAPPGIYFVRVRAANACGTSAPSNEMRVAVGQPCVGPPGPPAAVAASVAGATVTLTWRPAEGEVLGYILAVGSSSGANDVAIVDVGDLLTLAGTVPPGTYFARVHARNACGVGSPSNEITVVVR